MSEFRDGLTENSSDRGSYLINDLLRERYARLFVESKDVVFPTTTPTSSKWTRLKDFAETAGLGITETEPEEYSVSI